jgi:N-methylhydantoinase A
MRTSKRSATPSAASRKSAPATRGKAARPYCVGIDVGGTFTDAVLTDGKSVRRAKAPTTPDDRGRGVIHACRLVAERAGTTLEALLPQVARFGLGTTAVTNVLAERRGRRIGLLTTKGFEDQVPLAKGRKVLDGLWVTTPEPLVTAEQIAGIDERIDRDGRVLRPVDLDEVVRQARRLIAEADIEALAVSFLWSFKNSAHEDAAVGAIRRELPGFAVFSGAEVNPVMREFERSTFALLNAYVGGAFDSIQQLADELTRMGLAVPVLLVHSGGGSITAPEARRVPLGLAASGPAAGVAASVAVAHTTGVANAVTCDMGGTSFDVSVISEGEASRRTRGDLMGIWTALPQVDVVSIGAGGGSLGWVDARGMLRVGPHSAGAVPGPACYAKGGTEPAVTDALVVLGYLDPARFLGGEMELDADAAHRACERIGKRAGLDPLETAWGIREIALEGMIKAVRSLLNARGLDPRDHALVSFGGCGSLFTGDIAQAMGSPKVLVPELASVLSAFGAATADIRRDRVHSLGMPMPVDAGALQAIAEKLEAEVVEDLMADGVTVKNRRVHFEVDLRFKRQISELSIPLPRGQITERTLERVSQTFRKEYAKRYGQGAIVLGAPMELASIRAIGIGKTVRASLGTNARASVTAGTSAKVAGTRVLQLGREKRRKVNVFDGNALLPGHELSGPALIDGSDTTIWVPAKTRARVDEAATLVVEAF